MEILGKAWSSLTKVFTSAIDYNDVISENEEVEYLRMLTDFSAEEVLRLLNRFKEIVGEGKQTMTKAQFMALDAIHRNPLKDRIAVLFGFSTDETELDSVAFICSMGYFNGPGKREEKLKLAFSLHDWDDDGSITHADMVQYLETVTGESEAVTSLEIIEAVDNMFLEFEPHVRKRGLVISDFQLVVAATDFPSKLQLPI
jgi:Ca2+-binding EF-hand superfamily protein